MAKRLARKVKRAGKGATQFRFTSTLEYIEVTCKGTWRPEQLRVIWLRSHRRVHSQAVQWVATDDQGPNGAEGKAVFNPPIAISLIVTLYRDIKKARFDEKDYKYYIQNEGMGGKKILAAFTANLAEFVDITTTKHQLSMKLEPMSKKVRQATLALTVETEFMKEGRADDDDMQSTFSAVSLGEESLQFDDDDDVDEDEMDEAATARAGSEGTDSVNTASKSTPSNDADKMLPTSSNHVSLSKEEQLSAKVAAAAPSSSSSNSPGNDRIVPPVSEVEETDTSDEPARNEDSVSPTCTSDPVTSTWLPDLSLVDSNNAPASNSRVEEASVLGLYFSAEWCQPCRRFLPKLIRLYKILHKHQKPFEVIYVSNDNSETDMSRYMAEQKMPWVALPYGHALIKKLKKGYNVKSIPMLKIVSVDGSTINENARKMVEVANVESMVLKLFAQWVTGEEASSEEKPNRKASSPTLLNSLKKSLGREGSFSSSSPDSPRAELAKGKGQQRGREAAVEELLQKIMEKDQKIRHLEEVNMSLKQTNDDLNEDVANLKIKVKQAEEKLEKLQQSTDRLLKEEQTLKAQMELRGWLYKRGLKGPTANVWRRRFFRLDQGSKICYYKTATERNPQGFIDLLKVVNVSEVSPAQQDKNNATFHVQCEGRTYQMQAVDETTMRKWMAAIEYLRRFYSTQGRQ